MRPVQYQQQPPAFSGVVDSFLKTQAALQLEGMRYENELTSLALEIMLRDTNNKLANLESRYNTKFAEYKERGGELTSLMDINTSGNALTLSGNQQMKADEMLKSVFQNQQGYKSNLENAIVQLDERSGQLDVVDRILQDTDPDAFEGSGNDPEVFEKEDFWASLNANLATDLKEAELLPSIMGKGTYTPGTEGQTTVSWIDDYIADTITSATVNKRQQDYITEKARELEYSQLQTEHNLNYAKGNLQESEVLTKELTKLNTGLGEVISPIISSIDHQTSFKSYKLAYAQRVQYETGSGLSAKDLASDKLYQSYIAEEKAYLEALGLPLSLATGGVIPADGAGEQIVEHMKSSTDKNNPNFNLFIKDLKLMSGYYNGLANQSQKDKYAGLISATYGIDLSDPNFSTNLKVIESGLRAKEDIGVKLVNLNINGTINAQSNNVPMWFTNTIAANQGSLKTKLALKFASYAGFNNVTPDDIDISAFNADLWDFLEKAGADESSWVKHTETFLTIWEQDLQGGNVRYLNNK